MGFSGFVSSGLVPAVGGALAGVNQRRKAEEEQRRYQTQQAQLTSQTEWQRQQAIEAAQRQAMLDALNAKPEWERQGYTSRQEADEVRYPTVQDMPAIPPSIPEQMVEMDGPKGRGVYRVTRGSPPEYMGGVIPEDQGVPKPGMPGGPLKVLPNPQVEAISGLRSLLRSTKGAAADFAAHPGAFGPINRIPGVDLVPGSGSQYRLNMGDIVSQIGKLRSGGAITPQEFQRLERFLPNPGSLDEKNAAAIPRLLKELETILAEKTAYYSKLGYAVPEDVDAPADLNTDAPADAAGPAPDRGGRSGVSTAAQSAYEQWKAKQGRP